ncbi:MAG: hypothetical protein ACOC1G_08400, partial [Phycisphaeraceae bacterium]
MPLLEHATSSRSLTIRTNTSVEAKAAENGSANPGIVGAVNATNFTIDTGDLLDAYEFGGL